LFVDEPPKTPQHQEVVQDTHLITYVWFMTLEAQVQFVQK
jgi:hypothetical protein